MVNLAYALLTVKSVDAERRTFAGIATTPTPDRDGDIIEPLGIRFKNPIQLHLHHDQRLPVGTATLGTPTPAGIPFQASIPHVQEPGVVKSRVDEAWHSIRHGLIRGVSIGFRAARDGVETLRTGGSRFKAIEVLELSLVSIPANVEATITAIKSLDVARLAASGTSPRIPSTPGAAGLPTGRAMTTSEQLTAAKTELQTKSARFEELLNKDRDEGGLDQAETTERDTIKTAIKGLAGTIDNLSTLEMAQAARATGLTFHSPEAKRVHEQQTQTTKVEVKSLPKGTLFTRYAMAVAAGKGSYSDTLEYAKRWQGETPEVVTYVKSLHGKAIEGTSVLNSPAWGSQLVFQDNLASEFIELLRPATIMGRISGLRMSPFNVRIPSQTDASTVNWVGEAAVKPVSDLGFSTVTLPYHKIAGIVVLTEELVRLSTPNAEETVRRDLVEQIARFMDAQFITPSVSAGANNPASITNGVASPSAGGTTAEDLYFDLNAALATFDDVDLSTESLVILMTPALARGISTLRNALGQFEFGSLTRTGGTLLGFPVIVSSSVPSGHIILVVASEILVADDGRVTLDASNQATLDMNGGGSPTFSLWQRDCIGIRAERWVTWKKRRAESVAVIDTASYGPTAPA